MFTTNKINGTLSNVIYKIEFTNCNKFYLGKTKPVAETTLELIESTIRPTQAK